MSDPYQTLELGRGADARAIKTAYFRLMRLHPPEKEPEAFQRIRAAYELLSDPERRAEYDAELSRHDEHGAEAQAVLRASRECMSQEEYGKARDMLAHLLSQNPAIEEARELLGFALLRLDQAGPALQEFERLVQADPKSVTYRIHVAQTLHILEQLPQATAAARAALELDPTRADAAILLGELLGAQGQWDEAFAVWEKAIAIATSTVDALRLRLCFVSAHLERHDQKATEQALHTLEEELQRHRDHDLRRFVADRLAAMSAQLFATERSLAGNVLLSAAGRMTPTPIFEASLPSRLKVLLADLPEASREYLAQSVPRIRRPIFVWSNPWVWLVGSALCLSGALLAVNASTDPEPWGLEELLALSFLAVPFGLLLSFAVQSLRRRYQGASLRPYTFFHPLYLLTTGEDELVAWPLVRLQTAKVTDHHVNGAYQHTIIELDFGGKTFRLNMRGPQEAREWAQGALDARFRVFQLLSQGLLGAEPGADLIPHALLPHDRAPTKAERVRRLARWKTAAVGLGMAAALCAISVPLARRNADSHWAGRALSESSPKKLREYLGLFPNGRFASSVTSALDQRYADSLRKAEARAAAPLPAVKRLLETLRISPGLAVKVRTDTRPPEDGPARAPFEALLKDGAARDANLVARLRSAVAGLIGRDLFLDQGAGAALALSYAFEPSGSFQAPGRDPSPGLMVRCEAQLAVGQEVLASVTAGGPAQERYTTNARTLREDPAALQREMLLSALDGCAETLFAELAPAASRFERHASALLKPRPRAESPYRGGAR
ncbi:MAG: DnaJ domain-containing protein [Deltaproteobacteria bacterium]|nr:DnaJ domain-containing protein [Deltaproteobacteria bacterium]